MKQLQGSKFPWVCDLHSKYLVTFSPTQVKQCSNGMQCFSDVHPSFQIVVYLLKLFVLRAYKIKSE